MGLPYVYLGYWVEDHHRAEAAVGIVGIVERVDHRQAIGEDVGQCRGDQRAFAAAGEARVGTAEAVLDHHGVDVRIADHHRVVEDRHVGHAALGMALVEIAAEEGILVCRRARRGRRADQVAVPPGDAPEALGDLEGIDDAGR
jgi:hypothetical protein